MYSTNKSYVVGYVLSAVWTLVAFLVVTSGRLSGIAAILTIAFLAVIQLITQLVFFMHLGRGRDGRLNIAVFVSMLAILILVLGGSLWIMQNLNDRTMSPRQTDKYMREQSNKGF